MRTAFIPAHEVSEATAGGAFVSAPTVNASSRQDLQDTVDLSDDRFASRTTPDRSGC